MKSSSSLPLSSIGEFGLIQKLFAKLLKQRVEEIVVGPGDDCAVLRFSKNKTLLFTTDMLIEGIHFRTDWAGYKEIGQRALLVNVSDIAAMGGVPRFALISVGLPKNLEVSEAEELFQGMLDVCQKTGISIIGGDTNASGRIIINVTLIGEAPRGKFLTRSGAQAGDNIYVTGILGKSDLALQSQKHLIPPNRLSIGQKLVKNKHVHSLIDLSDGIVGDLKHILESSKVGAEVWVDCLPASKRFRGGGEDYELLFTASPQWKSPHHVQGVAITKVGRILPEKEGLRWIDSRGRSISKTFKMTGFEHF